MKAALVILAIAVAGLWGYNFGSLFGNRIEDQRLQGMTEERCFEIIAMKNVYTGNMDLVCEIVLQAEDDNVRIFRGKGAIDD